MDTLTAQLIEASAPTATSSPDHTRHDAEQRAALETHAATDLPAQVIGGLIALHQATPAIMHGIDTDYLRPHILQDLATTCTLLAKGFRALSDLADEYGTAPQDATPELRASRQALIGLLLGLTPTADGSTNAPDPQPGPDPQASGFVVHASGLIVPVRSLEHG